jgi:kynurenine formamidase
MTELEALRLASSCSNTDRWGPDDELGTLNYITAARRLRAIGLAKHGEVISVGRDIAFGQTSGQAPSAIQFMTLGSDFSAGDAVFLQPHGYDMTHLDALGHAFFDGFLYNNRRASDVVGPDGLRFGSVMAASEGIVTRGVFLDVAAAHSVSYLGAGYGISVADLEACEQVEGVRVESGDAIFLRSGIKVRMTRETAPAGVREGVLPEVISWIHRREVAVYSGDCIERLPSGFPKLPMPLHQIGLGAMGLMMLDNIDAEQLADACRTFGTYEFLLVVAPLRLPGATGSAVNPLAIF